jgi:uncharacterized membrane protein YkvA (DUF1232 family)
MNRFFGNLLDRTRNFLHVANHAWHDPRVPLPARIFVVLAPLYWINPFDLIPDLQPGGQCDDLTIACLLLVMALRLVPEAVFRDARKTVNPAVCGVMCLSLLGHAAASSAAELRPSAKDSVLNHAALSLSKKIRPNHDCVKTPELVSSNFAGERIKTDSPKVSTPFPSGDPNAVRSSDRELRPRVGSLGDQLYKLSATTSVSPPKEQQVTQHPARDRGDDRQTFRLNKVHDSSTYDHDLRILQTASIPIYDPIAVQPSLPIHLTIWGGQRQLYSPENASAPKLAFNSQYPFILPPLITGGIFVAAVNNTAPFRERSQRHQQALAFSVDAVVADQNAWADSEKTK